MEIRLSGKMECRFSSDEVAKLREDYREIMEEPANAAQLREHIFQEAKRRLGMFSNHATNLRTVVTDSGAIVVLRFGA